MVIGTSDHHHPLATATKFIRQFKLFSVTLENLIIVFSLPRATFL